MAASASPIIPEKPPTYDEATGSLISTSAVGGYGATGGQSNTPYTQQQTGLKSQPTSGYTGGYQSEPPAGQVYQAPPGYMPAGAVNQQPTYMQPATTVLVQPVVVVGGCPACRVGVLEDDFTCLGVCCAIFFFPLGLLCCLAMRQRRCPNCGSVFG